MSGGEVTRIEGDPDSPISRGRLCPMGSASKSLVTSPLRQRKVLYRRPHGTAWKTLDLPTAPSPSWNSSTAVAPAASPTTAGS